MNGICILLVAAAVAFGLAKLLRLPPIPLLMLVGAGIHELANFWQIEVPEDLLGEMMEIGLAMLVFTAGVDLSPRRMLGRTRSIIIVATVQFFILGLAGVLTAFALGYDLTIALLPMLLCVLAAIDDRMPQEFRSELFMLAGGLYVATAMSNSLSATTGIQVSTLAMAAATARLSWMSRRLAT
jgi:hypothetical protein